MQTRIRPALALTLLLAGCPGASVAEQVIPPSPAPQEAARETKKAAEPAPSPSPALAGQDSPDDSAKALNDARRAPSAPEGNDIIARGKASYYHLRFNGRRTASGQRYDNDAMTAAHRTLPFGTEVRVTNVRNGKSVVVRINDRGPFRKSRVIDVSGAAAQALGLLHHGIGEVTLSRP